MATVNANTVVSHPDGRAVSLLKGDEVPAWATDQVGGHLLDESEATPYREQKLADLKAEIARRNNDRPDDAKINPEGRASIDSYAAALEADDKAQAAGEAPGVVVTSDGVEHVGVVPASAAVENDQSGGSGS